MSQVAWRELLPHLGPRWSSGKGPRCDRCQRPGLIAWLSCLCGFFRRQPRVCLRNPKWWLMQSQMIYEIRTDHEAAKAYARDDPKLGPFIAEAESRGIDLWGKER